MKEVLKKLADLYSDIDNLDSTIKEFEEFREILIEYTKATEEAITEARNLKESTDVFVEETLKELMEFKRSETNEQ